MTPGERHRGPGTRARGPGGAGDAIAALSHLPRRSSRLLGIEGRLCRRSVLFPPHATTEEPSLELRDKGFF